MELVGFLFIWLLLLSPILAAIGCFIFVGIKGLQFGQKIHKSIGDYFFGYQILWAMAGVGVAFLGTVLITILTGSGQAPLGFIIYGPVGVAVGEVIGAIRWLRKLRLKSS